MELEHQLKGLTQENNKLKSDNRNLLNGIQTTNPKERNLHPDTDLSNPNAVAEELRQIKRKNDSLKKENEIIRRELSTFKKKGIRGGIMRN